MINEEWAKNPLLSIVHAKSHAEKKVKVIYAWQYSFIIVFIMHPLIAFLSFIFSPSDDWLLKQSYQLLIDPSRLPEAVQSYWDLSKQYPTMAQNEDGAKENVDALALSLWAEILKKQGNANEATFWLTQMANDPSLPKEITNDVALNLGETYLAKGDLDKAFEKFNSILNNPHSNRSFDARTNLLICHLAKNDLTSAETQAHELLTMTSAESELGRASFPLGLLAYSLKKYEDSKKYFSLTEKDPRSEYFLGLTYRQLNEPYLALTTFQNLKKDSDKELWRQLADFQIAETFFALKDFQLARAACEKGLTSNPIDFVKDRLEFRLASIDVKQKYFDAAVVKLTPLLEKKNIYPERVAALMAESLIKVGKNKDLNRLLANSMGKKASAQSSYELAWTALFNKNPEESAAFAEQGLEEHFDLEYTPRILLVQALAYEHLGREAEALATFQTIADRFPKSEAAVHATHWTTLAYMRAGRFREMVTHGSHLWAQLPQEIKKINPDTAYWLGEAHLKLNRFEDADKYFRDFLIKAEPQNPLVNHCLFQHSIALAKMNKSQESLAQLNEFIKKNQDKEKPELIALANLQRGHILFNDRQYAAAVSAYRTCDKSAKSLFHEALALYRLDYFSDAVDKWAELHKNFPSDPLSENGLFRMARTQFELGLTTSAVASFNNFITSYPQNPSVKEARLQCAHAFFNSGDVSSAAPLYADYLARYRTPEDLASITPYLASCYVKIGKSTREVEALLKGLPPTDVLASLYWNSGAQDYNQRKFPESAEVFASLLANYPAHENAPTAYFYRAESLFLQEKWMEADLAFQNFLAVTANKTEHAPLALFHQGVSRFNQDSLIKAGESFQRLLDEFPLNSLAQDAKDNLYLCYHNLGDWQTEEALKKKYSTSNYHTPSSPQLAQFDSINQNP
jgi:TolA-binding protein